MENKYVGMIVVSMAIVFLFIVISFNQALESIVSNSCSHGIQCPMQTTLFTQKVISYGLIGLLVLLGTIITFIKERKVTPAKAITSDISGITQEEKEKLLSNLDEEEKKSIDLIINNKGSIYQSELMKQMGYSKVKVTRLLDKLESKGLVERHRRGMTNIVVLK